MSDLVTYHNDFNKIKLPNFGEIEQNLLMGILVKLKNKKAERVKFTEQELKSFSSKNLTNSQFTDIIVSLQNNFFKADFSVVLKENEVMKKGRINLFQEFWISHYGTDTTIKDPFEIEFVVNPRFAYMLNELTKDFTEFELLEFIGISGKYAKTLYRLLKQFRNTGKMSIYKNDWQGFCEFMQIPSNYQMSDIDKRILKPAIKELSAEPNLFTSEKQTIFRNLTYKKIKDPNGRGRGGKVIGIEFYFTAEKDRNEILEKIQDLQKLGKELEKNAEPKSQILEKRQGIFGDEVSDLNAYIGRHFIVKSNYGGFDTCKITELAQDKQGKIYGYAINQENNRKFQLNFDSLTHLKNALKF